MLAVETSGWREFEAVTPADLANILGLDKQKQLYGCDDVSCMASIAGALDADELVFGSLAVTGTQLHLSLTRFNVKKTAVVNRIMEDVDNDADTLRPVAQTAVYKLFGKRPPGGLTTYQVASIATASGAIAAAAAATAFGVLGKSAADEATAVDRRSMARADWETLANTADQRFVISDICWGVAGAAALTAATLLVLDMLGFGQDEESSTHVAIAPGFLGGSSALLTVSGTW
jgi:hypothetical protein